MAALETAVEILAAEDRTSLPVGVRAERVLRLRRLADRLEGHWLHELAEVDARGAAGADHGTPAASTGSWLRNPACGWGPTPPAATCGPPERCSAAR